jgi:hypothetical protein
MQVGAPADSTTAAEDSFLTDLELLLKVLHASRKNVSANLRTAATLRAIIAELNKIDRGT